MAEQWLGALKSAKHKSGGIYPYLWAKPEKPPVRASSTAEYIRFCSWLSRFRPDAPSIQRSADFLRSKMLDNGAVPYEMHPRTLTPVKECPYLVADSISVALAAQASGDEELLGRSLDFIVWSYGQLPAGKFLPIWYHFESPQSSMPDHWSHQPSCHQAVVAQLELDEFVCLTWGDSIVEDMGDVLGLAMQSRTEAGFFDADRYRPETPLLPHFLTCESILKHLSDSGDEASLQAAAEGVSLGFAMLRAADGNGDVVEPGGSLAGHRRSRLLATAVRSALLANVVMGQEVVARDEVGEMMSALEGDAFGSGPLEGLLPVSSDSRWEEDTLASVAGCMVAFQAHTLLASEGLSVDDFRILV